MGKEKAHMKYESRKPFPSLKSGSVLKQTPLQVVCISSTTNAFNKIYFFFFDCLGHFYKEKVWVDEESL